MGNVTSPGFNGIFYRYASGDLLVALLTKIGLPPGGQFNLFTYSRKRSEEDIDTVDDDLDESKVGPVPQLGEFYDREVEKLWRRVRSQDPTRDKLSVLTDVRNQSCIMRGHTTYASPAGIARNPVKDGWWLPICRRNDTDTDTGLF